MGVDVFVRKAIMQKEFDCGGNLTPIIDEKEITVKTSGNVLQMNKILSNPEKSSEQETVKIDGFCPTYVELNLHQHRRSQ